MPRGMYEVYALRDDCVRVKVPLSFGLRSNVPRGMYEVYALRDDRA